MPGLGQNGAARPSQPHFVGWHVAARALQVQTPTLRRACKPIVERAVGRGQAAHLDVALRQPFGLQAGTDDECGLGFTLVGEEVERGADVVR